MLNQFLTKYKVTYAIDDVTFNKVLFAEDDHHGAQLAVDLKDAHWKLIDIEKDERTID
tara:strand:- start:243 stop:416 length:174 start_codon:yes stop_codon:yes gene_type:complete